LCSTGIKKWKKDSAEIVVLNNKDNDDLHVKGIDRVDSSCLKIFTMSFSGSTIWKQSLHLHNEQKIFYNRDNALMI